MTFKKRALSLIEVLIAFGLMAMLTAVILTGYRQMALLDHRSEEARRIVMNRKCMQERLSQIFSQVSQKMAPSSAALFTEIPKGEKTPHLIFYFDYGIDPDPAFSHAVKGDLFLSGDSVQLLVTSLSEPGKTREESLMKGVKNLSFLFLDFSEKESSKPEALWPQSQSRIPALLTLTCETESESIPFSFFLSAHAQSGIPFFKKT